jgi:hypothetical protein
VRGTSRTTIYLLVLLLAIGQAMGLAASDYIGQVTFNGVPVPGVTVTATHGDRKVSVTTDQDGIYQLADLADGVWNLAIEMLGFDTIEHEITVPAEHEPPPAALAVRSFDDLARDIPPSVETPSAPAVPALPPASAAAAASAASIDPTGIGAADGLLINGSLDNGNSTLFAQPRGFGNNRPRPPAGVYSYAAGLQLGNSAWDARPFSLTGATTSTPSYTDMQALGTFGGPIRLPRLRNAVNLFLGYQGGSATNANTQSTRMPTDRERAGDFSQTLNALGQRVRLIDPATGQPFAGNVIPSGRISPQAAALLAYYPHADREGAGRFNYQTPIIAATRQDGIQSTASYRINNPNQLNGAVSFQRTAANTTSLFGFEDSRDSAVFDAQAGWQLTMSRYTTLRARYQYTRTAAELVPYFANRVNVSGDAGITGIDQDPLNWGPSSLTFASDLAGLTDGRYSATVTRTHAWAGEIARFKGSHSVTVGGEIRRQANDVTGQPDPRGSFGFTGAASGVDFADFLLGLPQTSSIAFGNPDKYFRGRSYAAFLTDDWRVKPSLTLNVGLRWEYETPVTEAQGRLVNLDVAPGFTAVSPVLPGETGPLTGRNYSNALMVADTGGIEPRLGMAWRPAIGSSLVVRAGYGLYRNTNVYLPIAALLAQQPPFSTTFNVTTDPANPLTLANGFSSAAGATPFQTFAVDPNLRVATARNWQASVQRDLASGLTLLATYLGANGTHLMQQFLPNTFPAGAGNPCPGCPVGFRYLTSGGHSLRHAAQVQVRRRPSAGLTTAIEYTLAKAMDNAPAFGGASLDSSALAQDWRDLDADYARSNFDQRHLMTASAEYTTGVGIAGGTLRDGWKGRLLNDWTFTANLSTGSGLPLTPVYFAPIGGTGIIGSLRPDVTGVPADPAKGSYANPAAFATPAPGRWGDASRNAITGPATFSLNASVARTFRIGDRLNFDWRIDAANVLNRVTYGSVNTLITSPQFGLPNRANDMRKLRSSIRLRF